MTGSGDGKSLVLAAIDIVQLIGQSVKLTRRGREFVGLCPFHQEKTPSFYVVPHKQLFHCFGCKATGNAIDFVIKRDRIEFRDALHLLARQAGIDLPQSGAQKQQAGARQQLIEANAAAAAFFDKLLQHPTQGRPARDYLQKRGFTAESIRRFSIGFAPDSWDALLGSLSKKFPANLLQQAGLVKVRDGGGGFYDTFRNRLMFPIRDETGRTIGFGGRAMPGADEKTAKYLNSPETPLFSKGRAVFGLDLAKQRVIETRTAAVVEGYTDVVMAHQFGATNVVSILGTAMTENHVALLRRFADRIVLLFDADTAGETAVNRTVELFLTQPVEIAIASIPESLDPDEYLLKHGVEAFNQLLAGAADALTFKWRQLERQFNAAGDLTGQQKAVSAYLEVLAGARGAGPVDSLRWGAALSRVSRLTDIPVEALNRRFKPVRPPRRNVTDVAQPAESSEKPEKIGTSRTETAQDKAERWLLGGVLAWPQRWDEVQQHMQPQDFTCDLRRQLAEIVWEVARHDGHFELSELLSLLETDALKSLAAELVHEVESLESIEQVIEGAVQHIRRVRERLVDSGKFAELRRAAEEKTSTGDDKTEVELLRQLHERARRRAGGGS